MQYSWSRVIVGKYDRRHSLWSRNRTPSLNRFWKKIVGAGAALKEDGSETVLRSLKRKNKLALFKNIYLHYFC